MLVSKYFVWFIIYSFMGWIYESTYCTIRKHHWENRGFLHGPIVPIYGVGALLASILFSEFPISGMQEASNLKIFLICFFGSIVLEYTTSWALEKLFHAYWWDYSNVICNINGRVCLPASIGFGLAGILVVRVIYPFVSGMTHDTNVYLMEALSLVFMFLFGMDMALTVSALTNFAKNFNRIESEINEQITSAYEKLDTKAADAIGNMIEKSEQIQESAFVRKELAEEKAAALRERLTKERLESLFLSSSAAQKSTLLSIQGFKRSKDGNELRQRMRTMIDEKRHNRQK